MIVPIISGTVSRKWAKGTGGDAVAIGFQPGNLRRPAGADPNKHIARSLGANMGDQAPFVAYGALPLLPQTLNVRRLTPTECERLQGFPDNWTAWGIDGDGEREDMSDSRRYRMLGNAVTVNVAEWIGWRIVGVTP